MLGSDQSRAYRLEMICADFLAGANLQDGNPEALRLSVQRLLTMLPAKQRHELLQLVEITP
jgi:hypothetical protein